MSLLRFAVWFIIGLVGVSILVDLVKNPFIIGFIIAIIMGFLGAKDG